MREIPPLAQVTVTSRVLHMEHKYFYVEHRFEVQGRLHATALARVAVLQRRRVQPLQRMLAQLQPGYMFETEPVPESVLAKMALVS
ncbi:thioesterase family protein [Bacterioplanes sanyensis]|uniref:thioesterase family protein n=1 Tax=Bacterioplanes sanyensis TaxID=1249553 RepID=UPI003570B760